MSLPAVKSDVETFADFAASNVIEPAVVMFEVFLTYTKPFVETNLISAVWF